MQKPHNYCRPRIRQPWVEVGCGCNDVHAVSSETPSALFNIITRRLGHAAPVATIPGDYSRSDLLTRKQV
jgi:hypothetical protein